MLLQLLLLKQKKTASISKMHLFFTLLRQTAALFIEVLQWMMLGRAIFSWFPNLSETALGNFLYTVTEWFVLPVRALFDKFGWGQNMMLDIPFFVTYMILFMIGSML